MDSALSLRETRRHLIAPVCDHLVQAFVGRHAPGMPRSC